MKTKKILITAIGAPPKGYNEVLWQFDNRVFASPLPLIVLADYYRVDRIIVLGTKEALDTERTHFQQLMEELQKYHLKEKFEPIEIGALNTRQEFWLAFKSVTDNTIFKRDAAELYVDLTFGYRIQPMLIFLSAYFLTETSPKVKLKKIFYGMNNADPPHILDMTELVYLLDWLKGVQMFVQGGSAKILARNLSAITKQNFSEVAKTFEEFTDAYNFNYISYIPEKAKNFKEEYNQGKFVKFVKKEYPVISLIHPYLENFIDLFLGEDKLQMQLDAAKKNFEDGAYSRSVIILRETYITFLMEAFGFTKNRVREKVERILINRVFWSITSQKNKPSLTQKEILLANQTFNLLGEIFTTENMSRFYANWENIREMRNASGHVKNIQKGNDIDFSALKKKLSYYLSDTEILFKNMQKFYPKCSEYKTKIELLLKNELELLVFIVVNEGMHPIIPKLREQFGNQITVEVLTKGNVDLNAEREIARKCKALAEKYHDYKIYLVPSGFPYLAVAAYNVLQQTLARYPIWLQFDRESGKYLEKNLDPRQILNEN